MSQSFKKPLSRSKTPEPRSNTEDAVTRSVPRVCNRGETRLMKTASFSNKLPSRIAKSESDLSVQTKSAKPKTLSKEDRLALSYNAYLQSCLIELHDAEIREQKEKEIVSIMENQQLELMVLEEENNYLDAVLMKVKLFKQLKEEVQEKTEICQQIIDSTDEQELDSQIKAVEDNITRKLLKNFKLPETNEEKNTMLGLFKKISEELTMIPEIENIVQPFNDVCSSLLKAKELDDDVDKLKKTLKEKLKRAEEVLYDVLYCTSKLK